VANKTSRKSNSFVPTIIGGLVIIIIVVVISIWIAHDHSKVITSNNQLSSSQINADKQQIEANWKQFFAATTPLNTREQLLQNGSAFAQPMQAEFSTLSSAASSAIISQVTVNNNGTSASVSYTVDLNGQPVLKDQQGTALKINNAWKVSDSTLCGLLRMGGTQPPVCKNI
jgi:nitrogen fixation/metabolism regulation signal transduction histidine kinase